MNTDAIPRIWVVRERVKVSVLEDQEQDCFVIAASALEAAEIVGETERGRIVCIKEVCQISQLPGGRYKIVKQ